MSVFATDTHPILWFTLNKRGNLSKRALKAFTDAEAGNGFIYIPSVVLWEAAILNHKGRIKLTGGFSRWADGYEKFRLRTRAARTRNYQFSRRL